MKDQLETLQSPITTLELPIRLEAALYRAGLRTVGDVVALTPDHIMALPHVGTKSLGHLVNSLKSRDLCLTGVHLKSDLRAQSGHSVRLQCSLRPIPHAQCDPMTTVRPVTETTPTGDKPGKDAPKTTPATVGDRTTPPQDGAPVTEAESGSALQSTRYTRNLPIYAILPFGTDLLVWEVLDDQIVPRTSTWSKCLDDVYTSWWERGASCTWPVTHGRLQVCVRVRSFFGFVDKLIPIMERDISPELARAKDTYLYTNVELVVQKALFE